MSLIFRYLLRDYVKIFLICLGAFLLAYLAIDFFEKVRKFAEYGAESRSVARFFFLRLPRMVFEAAPLAALLSVLLAVGTLSRNSEFTALKSLGVGPVRMVSPFLSFGLAASLILLLMNFSVIPASFKKSQRIKEAEIEKQPQQSEFVQDRVWAKLSPTTFANIQLVDAAHRTLRGVSIFRLDSDFKLLEIIEADQLRDDSSKGWVLDSGVQRRLFPDGSIESRPIDRLPFALERDSNDFQRMQVNEEAMRYWELSRYVKRLSREGYVVPHFAVNLFEKVSYSFTTVVMVLLGIPFALRDSKSGGLARGVGISLSVGFLFWLTFSTVTSIGYGGILPPIVAAWLTHLLFVGVGIFLLMTVPW